MHFVIRYTYCTSFYSFTKCFSVLLIIKENNEQHNIGDQKDFAHAAAILSNL